MICAFQGAEAVVASAKEAVAPLGGEIIFKNKKNISVSNQYPLQHYLEQLKYQSICSWSYLFLLFYVFKQLRHISVWPRRGRKEKFGWNVKKKDSPPWRLNILKAVNGNNDVCFIEFFSIYSNKSCLLTWAKSPKTLLLF